MHRLAASAVGCLIAVVALAAQGSVNQEAHHKRVLYTNDVRVFEVVVPPGQTAADHTHEFDMATVNLGEGTVRISRNGENLSAEGSGGPGAVTISEQTGRPATFRIENTGATDYRAIEVENVREGGAFLTQEPMTAPSTTVLKQSRAFTIYDLRLKADTPAAVMHSHAWSTVVILLDGTMENGGIGGEEPVRLQRPGQWLSLPRAQNHTLAAVGGDAHVIEIEAR